MHTPMAALFQLAGQETWENLIIHLYIYVINYLIIIWKINTKIGNLSIEMPTITKTVKEALAFFQLASWGSHLNGFSTVLKEFPYILSTCWLLFHHSGFQLIPNHLSWVLAGWLWSSGHLMQHSITLLLLTELGCVFWVIVLLKTAQTRWDGVPVENAIVATLALNYE